MTRAIARLRASAAVATLVVLTAGVAVSLPATASVPAASRATTAALPEAPGVYRLSGADRYAASASISAATFAPGVPVAYVATGENFPDALSGGPAAGYEGGPVLLVRQGAVPAPVAAELTRLAPARIVVLGGPLSVSTAVQDALDAYTTGPVERISGADRYEASANVSRETFDIGVSVAYVATGATFPDALSGGPPAALGGGPVLLVRPDAVPAATAAELRRLAPERIVVLGGPASVSAGVQSALGAYTSATVERISGADRYEASAKVSERTFAAPVSVAYVATGQTFPDALSGGPAGAVGGGPVLLVRPTAVPAATASELARLNPRRIVVLGGPASVSTSVQAALEQYVDAGSVPSVRGTLTQEGGAGAPLAGVAVRVYDAARSPLPSLTTVTDVNGVYRVLGAPSGTVRLCFDGSQATGGSVDARGYESECLTNRLDVAGADGVTVAAGTTATRNAALRGLGSATVRITDTAGTPLSAVAVYVYGPRGLRVDGVTGAAGTVPLGALPASSAYVICYDPYDTHDGLAGPYGYDGFPDCTGAAAAVAPDLTVTAGSSTTRTVPVTASAVLEGFVADAAGDAVEGAVLVVENEVVAGDGLTVTTSTGADGFYQVGGVRGNRTHRVCVEPPPGWVARCVDGVSVPQARTTFLTITLTDAP